MTSAALARVAARSLARPSTRRSTAGALAKQQYSASAVTLGGTPGPLPPFARIPVESEKLPEQMDAIWDDGVAPEVTLDFDAQHISSGEAAAMWLGGFGCFALLYQVVKFSDPESKNPAVNREMNAVGEDPRDIGKWKELVEE